MPRGINSYDEARLQGRNVANANSSNIVAPGIVEDSLLLNFDAGNYESYPLAGTTWYDLSGRGINGTLTNGPVYIRDGGGAIDFDGTDDKVSGVIPSVPTDFAIEFFIKRDGNITDFGSVFSLWNPSSPGPVAGSLQIDFGATVGANTLRVVVFANLVVADTAAIADNTWTHFFITRYQNIYSIFRNGVITASATNTDTVSLTDFVIGQNRGANKFFSGAVSFFRFYSRSLPVQEIQQNFNATRARFGI